MKKLIALFATSAVASTSAMGAIGAHQDAQAQAAAQNRGIANQANQRNRQYELDNLRGIAEYNQDVMDVERQQDAQALAFAGFAAEPNWPSER